jgi:hypothetical protein
MFGLRRADAEGKNVAMLMPQPFRCVCRVCVRFCVLL